MSVSVAGGAGFAYAHFRVSIPLMDRQKSYKICLGSTAEVITSARGFRTQTMVPMGKAMLQKLRTHRRSPTGGAPKRIFLNV